MAVAVWQQKLLPIRLWLLPIVQLAPALLSTG